MASKQEKHEWELPHLREAHQIPLLAARTGDSDDEVLGSDLWSVKFYPYNKPGEDPVFAVVGNEYILVCRTPSREKRSTEIILAIEDEDPETTNSVCTWSKDLETGDPLLCVGGKAGIKVINALTGNLHQTLTGHGGDVDDLQVSPTDPQILASASEDTTIRIWSLNPAYAKQPCIAILAGDGHRETIFSLSFHASGRYLLSGGIDRRVNLWTLPEFPDENTGKPKPTQIYYPHFSTSEIHSAVVDCVSFYGDLIFSKAESEGHITLWTINGFSSANPPPSPLTAPSIHDGTRDTRSAFTKPDEPPWTRLLHFSISDSNIMFTRFSLFPGSAEKNPVLAFCTGGSKVLFWDLARLDIYHEYSKSLRRRTEDLDEPPPKRPPFLVPFRHRKRGDSNMVSAPAISRVRDTVRDRDRETSPTESSSSHPGSSSADPSHAPSISAIPQPPPTTNQLLLAAGEKPLSDRDLQKSKEIWSKRYALSDAWTDLAPHKEEVVRGLEFTGRQVAWSTAGELCVVVGSAGVIGVFERWSGVG